MKAEKENYKDKKNIETADKFAAQAKKRLHKVTFNKQLMSIVKLAIISANQYNI